ncbi:MAG: Ig-like domain-containing protein, partial [Bacteroidota bacterium]|nr:Ig-like domain-containing protein [Bacteroidota bacterium]
MRNSLPSLIPKSQPGGSSILQWLVYNQFIAFLTPRLVPARIVTVLLILFTAFQAQAQDVLVGLTSTNGPQGGGTAFSIKSDGTGFAVHKTFTKLGSIPIGELFQAKDGNFYGMTSKGGFSNFGTIFKMTPAGNITIMYEFAGFESNAPTGNNLIQARDGNFYGMTSSGGQHNGGAEPGVVFRMTPKGEYKVIYTFIRHQGFRPFGDLLEGPDGNFYGMTNYGGTFDMGTIFKLTPTGKHTVLHHFNGTSEGGRPEGNLVLGNDGNFYGLAASGGTNGYGTTFKISPAGHFTVLHNFEYATGGTPLGSLVKHSDGNFYGITRAGGDNYQGIIFRITPTGSYKVIRQFNFNEEGIKARRSLMLGKDGNFYGTTSGGGYNYKGTVFKITPGGAVTVLHSFGSSNDGEDINGLVQGADGNLYGTAQNGGSQSSGTIFRISTSGTNFKVLSALPGTLGGVAPRGSLVQGRDGYFYGMTEWGGTYNSGTIFRLCSDGSYTILRSLEHKDGIYPVGDLMLGKDGNFYGLAAGGGENGSGTYFRITPKGDFTVLYSFQSDNTGYSPWGSLVDGNDGFYYGMTNAGGQGSSGVIFKVTPTGDYTVLHRLNNEKDGSSPRGNLIKAGDGNFYGLTSTGGEYNTGTFFKVTPNGKFTKLHSFYQYEHGDMPTGSLVQGKDGNFYGMTARGGKDKFGTIFRFTPSGQITILKFMTDAYNDGAYPQGSLVMDKEGNFYGLTSKGGHNFQGTLFKITPDGNHTILHHFNSSTDGSNPYGSLIIRKANPVAYSQNVTTAVNTSKAITLKGTGGSPLVYEIVSQTKNGTLSGSGPNRTYRPKAGYTGSDSFTYRVVWGCQSSTVKKVSITVGPTIASTIRVISALEEREPVARLFPNPATDKF